MVLNKKWIFVVVLFSLMSGVAGAEYSAPITVTNNPGVSGYQARINLTYQTGMSADFANIRFYNGTTEIPYWVQDSVSSTNATVWIPINATTNLTCRWGITGETASESSISAVMEMGDDFNSLNSSTWTSSGATVSDGVVTITATNTDSYIYATSTWGTGYTVMGRVKTSKAGGVTSATYERPIGWVSGAYESFFGVREGASPAPRINNIYVTDTATAFTVTWPANTYQVVNASRTATGFTVTTLGASQSSSSTYYTGAMSPRVRAISQSASVTSTVYADWICVRKYAATEPTLTLGSVTQTPVAAFSGTPTSGSRPLSVTFTDSSTNSPTSWSWNFGDSSTSTEQNPTHEFESAGTYTVTLTATNSVGSSTETKTNYITVSTPVYAPVAAFSGTPTSGSRPLSVTFTDSSTNSPTSWSWDLGDGNTSTAQNPIHTYYAVGTYTVTLTATNSAGFDSEVKTDYVTVSNNVPDISCLLISVTSNDDVPDGYQLSFEIPWKSGMASDFSNVRFYANNTNINGGTELAYWLETYTASETATVWISLPKGTTSIYCIWGIAGETESESNISAAYDFINNVESGTTTGWDIKASYGSVGVKSDYKYGSYSVGSDQGASQGSMSDYYTYNQNHVFFGIPLDDFPIGSTILVNGSACSWSTTSGGFSSYWGIGDSATVYPMSRTSPTPVWHTYNIYVTRNSADSWGFVVYQDGTTVATKEVSKTFSTNFSMGVQVSHSGTSSTAYFRLDDVTVRKYAVSGAPTITISDTVYTPVINSFVAYSTSGFMPYSVQFYDTSAGNPSDWLWSFGDGSTSTEQNPKHTYTAAGTYTVTMTASNFINNDTTSHVDYVTVIPHVEVNFSRTATYNETALIVQFQDTTTSGTPIGWLWDFGDGNTSTEQNPIHVYYPYTGSFNTSLRVTTAYEEGVASHVVRAPPAAGDISISNIANRVLILDENTSYAFNISSNKTIDHTEFWVNGELFYVDGYELIYTFTEGGMYYNVTAYGVSGSGNYSEPVTWKVTVHRGVATTHIEKFDESNYNTLMSNITHFNVTGITAVSVTPFTDLIGRAFYLILFLMPYAMLWMKQRMLTIPVVMALVTGCLFICFIPAQYLGFVTYAVILSFAVGLYLLGRERF